MYGSVKPIITLHALTPLGQSLQRPFAHLYDWTVEHMDEIGTVQQSYDLRSEAAGRSSDD